MPHETRVQATVGVQGGNAMRCSVRVKAAAFG
jgi:hypothetical protein